MKKAVLLITIVLLEITGCFQKSSVTEQTTAIETTVTMEAKGSDNTSLSAESETSDEADIYGNLGEDFFNQNVISYWKDYTIPDEQTLRERMDTVYGDLSTKEDLIQIVLATPRDPQPTQSQPAETQATQTPNSKKETKSNNTATQPAKSTLPPSSLSAEEQAELDRIKAEDRAKSGSNVDNNGGAGGVNERADEAAKGWQWQ